MATITFEDYKKEILNKFWKEKKGEFSRFFEDPTPGKIKKVGRQIILKRGANNDQQTLLDFFDLNEETNFKTYFSKVDPERFKSVQQFLKGKTTSPDENLIEFVAWLVNFEHRPYSKFRKSNVNDLIKKSTFKSEVIVENTKSDAFNKSYIKTVTKKQGVLSWRILIGILIIICSAFYITVQLKSSECMTWVKDHYEKVVCEENYNQKIITLDKKILKGCKKVSLNISMIFFEKGQPLYWYSKTNGKIEFFTCLGLHPVSGQKLSPITETIIRKYIYKE